MYSTCHLLYYFDGCLKFLGLTFSHNLNPVQANLIDYILSCLDFMSEMSSIHSQILNWLEMQYSRKIDFRIIKDLTDLAFGDEGGLVVSHIVMWAMVTIRIFVFLNRWDCWSFPIVLDLFSKNDSDFVQPCFPLWQYDHDYIQMLLDLYDHHVDWSIGGGHRVYSRLIENLNSYVIKSFVTIEYLALCYSLSIDSYDTVHHFN